MNQTAPAQMDEEWLTTRQISLMMARSYWTAATLAAGGAFGAPTRVSGRCFYRRDAVEEGVTRWRADSSRRRSAPIAVAS